MVEAQHKIAYDGNQFTNYRAAFWLITMILLESHYVYLDNPQILVHAIYHMIQSYALPLTTHSFTSYPGDKLSRWIHISISGICLLHKLALASRERETTVNDGRSKEPLSDEKPP